MSPTRILLALLVAAPAVRGVEDGDCEPPGSADISLFVPGTQERVAEFVTRGRSVHAQGRTGDSDTEGSFEYQAESVYCQGGGQGMTMMFLGPGVDDKVIIRFAPDGLPSYVFGRLNTTQIGVQRYKVDVRGVWDGRRFARSANATPTPAAPAPRAAPAIRVAEAHHQELRALFKQATPATPASAATAQMKKACLLGDDDACARLGQPRPAKKDLCTDCLTNRSVCLAGCGAAPGIGDLAVACGPEEGATGQWQSRAELKAATERIRKRNECVDREQSSFKKCTRSCGTCPPPCDRSARPAN